MEEGEPLCASLFPLFYGRMDPTMRLIVPIPPKTEVYTRRGIPPPKVHPEVGTPCGTPCGTPEDGTPYGTPYGTPVGHEKHSLVYTRGS